MFPLKLILSAIHSLNRKVYVLGSHALFINEPLQDLLEPKPVTLNYTLLPMGLAAGDRSRQPGTRRTCSRQLAVLTQGLPRSFQEHRTSWTIAA